jgi:ribonucleoside-diphosphate reductase alpha chain
VTNIPRQRLPNKRASTTFEFKHNHILYACTYSRFAGGNVAEAFLGNHKSGSHLDACVRDLGVAASLALQFGCPLDTLRGALLRNADGTPATALGAALDLIAAEEGGS